MLWVVPWPNSGNVQDFLNNFRRHIQGHLESSDVHLVFDRCTAGSIKESIRNDRDQVTSRVSELRPLARLPAQKVVLTVNRNKTHFVNLIMEDLQAHKDVLNRKLVITGNDPVPVQINEGVVSKMEGMTTTHEEANTMIIHQVAYVGANNVLVVADDTDIFVLLCHFMFRGYITGHVMMISPIRGKTVIDINSSVDKNPAVMEDILAASQPTMALAKGLR